MKERWRGVTYSLMQLHGPIVILVSLLTLFGVVMMISAGGGSLTPWADKQLIRGALGFVLMIVVAVVPSTFWLRYAYVFFGGGLIMLLVTAAIGFLGKGAQRWVELGGVNLQPSELMKLCLILALARFYHNTPPGTANQPTRLLTALGMVMLPALLILKQPNLGTATITSIIGISIIFLMGLRWKLILPVVIGAVAAMPLAWGFLKDYQKQRVLTFLDPSKDPLGHGYNIIQSMIAIGSGGFNGKGYLQGTQGQLDFLPEKHTDFIFTMVAEEFGFIGSVILLLAFLLLIIYAFGVSMRSRSTFGSLVAAGIAMLLFSHLAINVAMVMGLIPVVGLPLPLISYGGSIQISTLIGCGLLLNAFVYRDLQLKKSSM